MRYLGVAVCPGRVLSRCHKLPALPQFDLNQRTDAPVEDSIRRVSDACAQLISDFTASPAYQRGGATRELMDVQMAMLDDCCFTDEINAEIRTGFAPEAAVLRVAARQEEALRALNDAYLSARAEDVHDLGVRLACRVMCAPYPSLSELTENCVVAAHDLLPSMLMTAEVSRIRGIVSETGTKTSHVSILASGLEIPTVVACPGAMNMRDGEPVYLDGEMGYVDAALNDSAVSEAAAAEKAYLLERSQLLQFTEREAVTADGVRIGLHANVMDPMTLDKAISYQADGVGLFRTEFLYMNRSALPTEEEQFQIYHNAARKLQNRPLIIRTMDVGGDKEAACLHLPKEANPFMGYRAVRICMDRPEVLMPQLRAILRANQNGNVWVMFPMVAVKKELTAMCAALEEAKRQLSAEGLPFGADIPVGIMVEVPSAAILLDQLAPMLDFVSIGSNDLTQYTYAADRMNTRVGYLYDFMDPAVLRLIRRTITVSDHSGLVCSLCGEMAGDGLGLAALIALGIRKVSVSPAKLLKTKQRLRMLRCADLGSVWESIINAEDATEAIRLLSSALPKDYPAGR